MNKNTGKMMVGGGKAKYWDKTCLHSVTYKFHMTYPEIKIRLPQ
jgi:hypothetical protein